METLHVVTLHVITVSSWIKHEMIFNCEETLLKRAAKDVERTSAKLQRNPRWNDTFNGQLFSKVTWKYVLCMNIYHILICSSLVVTLLRTSSIESLIYMCMIQRTRVSAPLLPFRINVVPLGNTAAGRRYMYGKKKNRASCSFGSSTQGRCTLRTGRGCKGNMLRAVHFSYAHTYWQMWV